MFAKIYTNIVSVNLFYKCGGDVSRCHILRNIMSARNTMAQVKNKFVDTIGSKNLRGYGRNESALHLRNVCLTNATVCALT